MFLATIILSVLLALAFAAAGLSKLRGAEPLRSNLDRLNVGRSFQKIIGALEVLGAAGLVAGIWLPALGIAAGVGLALVMVGAIVYHVRAGDAPKEISGSAILLVLSILVVVLRSLSA